MLNNWFQNATQHAMCTQKTTVFSAGCNVMYRKIIHLYSAVNNTESLQGRRTKSQLKGSVKEPNISMYFFFLPITQWYSISDVPFTGGRGVSDFSVLKYY